MGTARCPEGRAQTTLATERGSVSLLKATLTIKHPKRPARCLLVIGAQPVVAVTAFGNKDVCVLFKTTDTSIIHSSEDRETT